MVTNTELTIDMITEEALIILKNSLGLGNRCLRQYDESFGMEGAKIGDTLRVRVPVRYVSTTGPAPAAQNFTETYKAVAAQTQRNVILNFNSKDLALAIDEFSERVIEPAVVQLSSDIDTDGTTVATSGYTIVNNGYVTANYAGAYAGFMGCVTQGGYTSNGTPVAWTGASIGSGSVGGQGTPQGNASAAFFNAQARLTEQAAPTRERYTVISPAAAAAAIPNLYTLFNPTATVSKMFEDGMISGSFAGAETYQSPSVQSFLSGNWTNSGAATNVATAVVSGATSVTVQGIGNNANVNAGDQLVIAGIFSVNPVTRMGNQLQVFTAVGAAQANATGVVTLNVYPAIANSGAYQTVSALPQVANAVTFLGTSATSTSANFMYEKNAIALVVAPLSEDLDGAKVSRASSEEDGLSIRFVSQYQASSDIVVKRLDILYGWAVVRPELGCLIKG
jgi:P22 coat protein - gene protein 5